MPALSNQKQFYVYVVAIGARVVYVGKGSGQRYKRHFNKGSHNGPLNKLISVAISEGKSVRSKIIRSSLTEGQAFNLERMLIASWRDRRDLCNIDRGRWSELQRADAECQLIKAELVSLENTIQTRSQTLSPKLRREVSETMWDTIEWITKEAKKERSIMGWSEHGATI